MLNLSSAHAYNLVTFKISLTLYYTMPSSDDPWDASLQKHSGKKEKWPVTAFPPFPKKVFYIFTNNCHHFTNI